MLLKIQLVLIEAFILAVRFRLRAGHRRGRGVHPPFAYVFIRDVVFGDRIPDLERIEELRQSLLAERKVLHVEDPGAGSRRFAGGNRSIRRLVRHTAVDEKKGQLLARIVRYLGVPVILELGTGTGISTLYLALACPRSKVLTCEGSPSVAALARENLRRMEAGNVEVVVKKFGEWLPGALNHSLPETFIYIDGDHREERLLEYMDTILVRGPDKAVVVLDDIHWSADMYRTWRTLAGRNEISLSLELYNTGILFVGYDIQKGYFAVNF